MDVREKLADMLFAEVYSGGIICDGDTYKQVRDGFIKIADRLIAHGATVQEWISVKDRLPEESGMYIVTANDGHAQRVSFVLWQKKNRTWNLTGARSYWRVTHWQPLPQPPEGE